MTYATLADLTDRFGETELISLTDRDKVTTGAIDTDVIDRALADTDAQITGYLAGRYALPLVATPPLIKDLALVISFYKLHRYEPDTKVRKDYEDAQRSLRDISAGTIRLPVAGLEPDSKGGTGVRVTDRERPMTADKMTGFI